MTTVANSYLSSSWHQAKVWRMSRVEYNVMVRWCIEHQADVKVLEWLDRNPPDMAYWKGTRLEWAYLEMPQSPGFK